MVIRCLRSLNKFKPCDDDEELDDNKEEEYDGGQKPHDARKNGNVQFSISEIGRYSRC